MHSMNRLRLTACSAIVLAAVSGCGLDNPDGTTSGKIRLRVNTSQTRSIETTTSGLEKAGKFVLDAFCDDDWERRDDHNNVIGSGSAGAYITSGDNYNAIYSSAQVDDTGRTDEHSDFWYINDASGVETYNWLANDMIRFWCHWPNEAGCNGSLYFPVSGKPGAGSTQMSFGYYLPSAVPGDDADNQQDIVFAYAERKYSGGNDNIDINFNHPLSEIRFCVSPDDGTFDVSLSIKNIEITNVPQGGTCLFNGKGLIQPTTANPDPMFTWTVDPAYIVNCSQDYDEVMFDSKPDGWNDSSYKNASDETKHLYVTTNNFMLIPHTPAFTTAGNSSNAQLSVTFGNTGTGSDIIKTVDINPGSATVWKPGHYYTYKICATLLGRDIHVYVILQDWTDRDSKIIIS